MPITTHPHEVERYNGDLQHWMHVMRTLFVPAIEAAGFEPIEPAAQGSDMIHGRIIEHLATADMVLCDLSSHNPNVFFELGVRTALDKPIALVVDEHTKLPFDLNGLNTQTYASTLLGWELADQTKVIGDHLVAAVASCSGANPMWRRFGLNMTAERPSQEGSATDARIELILDELSDIRQEQRRQRSDEALSPSARLRERFSLREATDVSGSKEVMNLASSIAHILNVDEYVVSSDGDESPVLTYPYPLGKPFPQEAALEIGDVATRAGWLTATRMQADGHLVVTLWARAPH